MGYLRARLGRRGVHTTASRRLVSSIGSSRLEVPHYTPYAFRVDLEEIEISFLPRLEPLSARVTSIGAGSSCATTRRRDASRWYS